MHHYIAVELDTPLPRPERQTFQWLKAWYPVAIVSFLDTDKPNGVTLLGRDLVVWQDGEGAWNVNSNQCPHRQVIFPVLRPDLLLIFCSSMPACS